MSRDLREKWRHHRTFKLAALSAIAPLSIATASHAQVSYKIVPLGLTGSGYSYLSSGSTVESSFSYDMDDAGRAVGSSVRYNSSGSNLGEDAWYYDGASMNTLGLTGANYTYASQVTGGGNIEYSTAYANTASGIVGTSNRYNSVGTYLGVDAWIYSAGVTKLIGLTGGTYSKASTGNGGGVYQYNHLARTLDNPGIVAGTASRFGSGANLGVDDWIYDGTSTVEVGLTGTNYSYATTGGNYQSSAVSGLASNGILLGSTNRYNALGTSLGVDSWTYHNGSMTVLGLTNGANTATISGAGGGTYESSTITCQNLSGQAAGASVRPTATTTNGLGLDAWYFDGTSTRQIGYTGAGYGYTISGSGTYEYSSCLAVSNSGLVIGTSTLYSSSGSNIGADGWLYDGKSLTRMGLTGSVYQYTNFDGLHKSTSPRLVNNSGEVAGFSERFSSTGANLGSDAWVYNAGSTTQVGLTGANYSYTDSFGTHQQNGVQLMNNAGQVVGTTDRFTSSGTDFGAAAWFFDPASKTTSPLEFSFSNGGYWMTTPLSLSEGGVVLGTYESYSGGNDLGARAFWWNKSLGFFDLGSLDATGLSNDGWQMLADVYQTMSFTPDGTPLYIVGHGQRTGQSTATSAFLMTAQSTLIFAPGHTTTASTDAGIGTAGYGMAFTGGTLSLTASTTSSRGIAVESGGGTISIASGATFALSGTGSTGWYGGTLSVTGGGVLNLSRNGGSVHAFTGSTLNIASGSSVIIGGSFDPLTDSTTTTQHVAVVDNGFLEVDRASTAASITGIGALTVGTGSSNNTFHLAVGGGANAIGTLTIKAGSALDITNNRLFINYGSGADPKTTLLQYLKTGSAGGTWTGAGIDSSTASVSGTNYGVAFADGADGVATGLTSGQIEMAYALLGDITLTGRVNATDFGILAGNFGKSVTGGWEQGDLNYDGKVNATDFSDLASNFGKSQSGAAIALPAADWAALDSFAAAHGLLADVPEPSLLPVIPLAICSIRRRRRMPL